MTSALWQIFLLGVFSLSFSSPTLAEKPVAPEAIAGVVRVDTQQVVDLILSTPDLVIIDARHADAYQRGHIEGALNYIDVDIDADLLSLLLKTENTPLLLYCNGPHCLRSANAATKALEFGYRRIYWYRDGWQQWRESQLPVAY
ncbi:MAG: rhodanese-like domain-containing protein [Gammaproteobacteria bacterium]|nr:rhodanese-like domain-containing protein [Gammaproteobacteria bacterium]